MSRPVPTTLHPLAPRSFARQRRRRRRRPVLAGIAAAVALGVPAAPGAAASCLLPPVAAPVTDPYREPPCPWCPGNRGLHYELAEETIVRAAASGTVSFSGTVAGVRYVVVAHSDGLRATYGRLAATTLHSGDRIAAGAVVGRSTTSLHFGLRRGDAYVDPEPLIGRLVERLRLLPTDGTPPRSAPPPRVVCAGAR